MTENLMTFELLFLVKKFPDAHVTKIIFSFYTILKPSLSDPYKSPPNHQHVNRGQSYVVRTY